MNMMLDEMYLEKANDYHAGNMIGANKDGDLYRGILIFMIVGFKEYIPYVIKSGPEVSINSSLVIKETLPSLTSLKSAGFRARVIVCDIHSCNISAFLSLMNSHGGKSDKDGCFIEYEGSKVYLISV